MLVDIFARRYEGVEIRDNFEPRDSRVLIQTFRIISEDIFPYYIGRTEDKRGVAFWTRLHGLLSRELGVQELSAQWFSYQATFNGNTSWQTHKHTLLKVCENWLNLPVSGLPDVHIKERLSLIELGFRERENEIAAINAQPIPVFPVRASSSRSAMQLPGNAREGIIKARAKVSADFQVTVEELNGRFRQAGYPLHYHNGYIQISTDDLVQKEIESPFWALIASPLWANVDTDMKDPLDLRDSDGRDPAFFAARALESTIKIISDRKGWTSGKEKGAHNYIDNIAANANQLITKWEGTALKDFFTHVRNPFGHGPGSGQMPNLARHQTEWAIEYCMSWIKNLIRRL